MEQNYPGGRNLVRKAYELRGTPEAALEVTLASISDTSYKQYEGCFKKWWSYCTENNIDPFTVSIPNILIFLTNLFNRNLSSSTINCYRSAVSLLVGREMARDDRITRFFQGLNNLRPSDPKYDTTWDPQIVLDYLSSLPNNNDLSILILGKKLISLLALVTAHRMQTFSLIEIENIDVKRDALHIKIPKRIKTTGRNKKQPTLVLPFYRDNEKICPATALQSYIEKTKDKRGDENFLFLTSKKPHKAATAATLGRWVKDILSKSGLNTNIFTAHSTRHASTSTASRKGINIDTIRMTAGWTQNSNTFAIFYNRDISVSKNVFANAIIKN